MSWRQVRRHSLKCACCGKQLEARTGATKAREAASKLTALLNRGVAVEEALKQAGIVGQSRQPLAVRRAELGQYQGKIPPPIIAAARHARGFGARWCQMERNFGFAVVWIAKITEADPRGNAQLMQSTRAGLANVLGSEYAAQFTAAIEKDIDVERNPAAMRRRGEGPARRQRRRRSKAGP